MALTPKLPAPKVVGRGSLRVPVSGAKAKLSAPLLATPSVFTPPALPHQKGPSGGKKNGK